MFKRAPIRNFFFQWDGFDKIFDLFSKNKKLKFLNFEILSIPFRFRQFYESYKLRIRQDFFFDKIETMAEHSWAGCVHSRSLTQCQSSKQGSKVGKITQIKETLRWYYVDKRILPLLSYKFTIVVCSNDFFRSKPNTFDFVIFQFFYKEI